MPKIIPGLQDKLLTEARRLFMEKGYVQTELRDVAAAAGTSVGNIYNYYRSKPHLFLAVVQLWRSELGEEMMAVLGSEKSPEQKVYGIMEIQYRQARAVHGLWKEFFTDAMKAFKDDQCQALWKEMEAKVDKMLAQVEELLYQANPDLEPGLAASSGRWASLLLAAIFQLPMKYAGQDEENLRFIRTMISQITRKTL